MKIFNGLKKIAGKLKNAVENQAELKRKSWEFVLQA